MNEVEFYLLIFLPSAILYGIVWAKTWSTARPLFPLWFLWISVFFPVLLPFVIVSAVCATPVVEETQVVARIV